MQFTDLVDWALKQEDDATLQGEVQYFRTHHSKAIQIACRIGMLKESLQTERLAIYHSSEHLAAANAITCIHHCIDHDMHKAPYFKGNEDVKLKSLFAIMPCMPGARTMAKCATGVARQVTTLRSVTPSAIANTACSAAMMELTVYALMTFATSLKIARSTHLTPTLNAAIALLLMMTLTSKGH